MSEKLDAPDWLVEAVHELRRPMSSTDRSIADGIWLQLDRRGLLARDDDPDRTHDLSGELVKPIEQGCLTCTGHASFADGRFCPRCEKYRLTCINDHCMECGAAT